MKHAALVLAMTLWGGRAMPQLLPPPGDGEIRIVYWDLRDETEFWLTIEPKSPDGKPAPPAMVLTIGRMYPGKVPTAPPDTFNVRVSAGMMWNPQVDLQFTFDGKTIVLASGNFPGMVVGGPGSDYLPATIPAQVLQRVAAADHISGSALGLKFELTPSQRAALRTFIARAMSADPARTR